jgi:N-methylhydantoinase A
MSEAGLRFGVDTGGTFTDLVVEGLPDGLRFYKRPTTPDDPVRGLLDVITFAAGDLGLAAGELLARGAMFIHGTTRATNAIVEGATARTAFLTTKGHRDILLIREGGGRRGALDYTQTYPDPYIPRALTFEVGERIRADGRVSVPLDEDALIETCARLRELRVEAVAVCLLWSIVNPAHELRVGELLERHLPGVPFTLSHRLNPAMREYRRASSAAIDASLKPLMSRYIRELDSRLREAGFGGRLLILTSGGGVLDAADVWDTPIHTIGSGPAAAPVAGRYFAGLDAGARDAIVTDAGGTTYDVSLIRRGRIPWTRETMVDRAGELHMTGFPSVDVRSIGAGGGSIGWVDRGGLLHVGPQSAGAAPGPACWGRGGVRPTVTDACLVLGYIDPDYFLGGAMPLNRELAIEAITRDVGDPLGLDLRAAANAIFQLACERMVTAIDEITLKQGIDAREAVLIGGGGGGGLYSATIARRLGVAEVIVPSVSAALSAAGALLSDLSRDFATTAFTSTKSYNFDLASRVIADLKRRCAEFIAGPGAGSTHVEIALSVEARYPNQVWEIEAPIPDAAFPDAEAVERFRRDFHRVHQDLFAVADIGAHVEIVSWRVHVSCALLGQGIRPSAAPLEISPARRRAAFFDGFGECDTQVRRHASLAPGETLDGPAIVESPVTTVVAPPGASITRLASGSLRMTPHAAATLAPEASLS